MSTGFIKIRLFLMMMMMIMMTIIMMIMMMMAGGGRRAVEWLGVKENQSLSLECRSSGVCITIIITILTHYNYINISL